MPIIKSAKKRVRVTKKAAIRNRKTKRSLKSALQGFNGSVSGNDKKQIASTHAAAQSAISKAVKKHVIHKNKAARKQRQLAAKAKAIAPVAPSKTSAAKKPATAKKPAAKKTVKKPAAKKE